MDTELDKVEVLTKRVICVRSSIQPSPEIIDTVFEKVLQYYYDNQWENFVYIIDLRKAKRPNPKTRKRIVERLNAIDAIILKNIFICENHLLKVAVNFIMYHFASKYTIVNTETEALHLSKQILDKN